MKNLLLLLVFCTFSSSHAGRISWDVITVNHFWTIFDAIKSGDIVSAELIGAAEGDYQLQNSYGTGIEGYDHFFFVPHPGPGYPIRVTTRASVYGKRPIAAGSSLVDLHNDSKELTGYRAGSVYNNLNIGSAITIDGIRCEVIGQYPRIDMLRIFTLVGNDNKQKKLILENREDVGNVFLSCEDMPEENNIIEYQEQDEEFNSCCNIAAQFTLAILKKIVAKESQ